MMAQRHNDDDDDNDVKIKASQTRRRWDQINQDVINGRQANCRKTGLGD